MTTDPGDAGLLILVGELQQQVGRLQERLEHETKDLGTRLGNAFRLLHGMRQDLQALDGSPGRFDDLDQKIAQLAARPAPADHDNPDYQPQETARWWDRAFTTPVAGADGDQASSEAEERISEISDWLDAIWRPGYEFFGDAKVVPPCWASHSLILYILDMLMETWKVMYLSPRTTPLLLSQMQFQSRILPDLRRQLAESASGCAHAAKLTEVHNGQVS